MSNETPNTPGLRAMVRAELAAARAGLCPHGISRNVKCEACDLAEDRTEEMA